MKIKEQQSDTQIHTPVFTHLSTLEKEREREKEQREKNEKKYVYKESKDRYNNSLFNS